MEPAADQPIFFYDLGSPACYLVAERVVSELAVLPEWEPVLGAHLGLTEPSPDLDTLRGEVRAAGLQPLRFPSQWPADTARAMLAATYAKRVGRVVSFSLAAFRQAFAGGRDLGDESTILIAGAACEMHPTAILKGMELRSVVKALRAAAERARSAGADSLPAIQVAGELFAGERCLERAAAALTWTRVRP